AHTGRLKGRRPRTAPPGPTPPRGAAPPNPAAPTPAPPPRNHRASVASQQTTSATPPASPPATTAIPTLSPTIGARARKTCARCIQTVAADQESGRPLRPAFHTRLARGIVAKVLSTTQPRIA